MMNESKIPEYNLTTPPIKIPVEWEAEVIKLLECLKLYADPGFYHACAFMFDKPTGGFDEDFDYSEDYDRDMPGKYARKTMADFIARVDLYANGPQTKPLEINIPEEQPSVDYLIVKPQHEVRSSNLPSRSVVWIVRTWLGDLCWTVGTRLIGLGNRVGAWDRCGLPQSVQPQDP